MDWFWYGNWMVSSSVVFQNSSHHHLFDKIIQLVCWSDRYASFFNRVLWYYQSGEENPPGGTLFFNLSCETGCGGPWIRSGVKNCPGCPISSPVTGLTKQKNILHYENDKS